MHRQTCCRPVGLVEHNILHRLQSEIHLNKNVHQSARSGNDSEKLQQNSFQTCLITTHTHPFNGPLSRTTRVSQYQKGKTNLDFTEARDSEWHWHQLGHMQVCISLQTDNHASTPPLSFLQAGCPSCHPTNSVKALKASLITTPQHNSEQQASCVAMAYSLKSTQLKSCSYSLMFQSFRRLLK